MTRWMLLGVYLIVVAVSWGITLAILKVAYG